MNQITMGNTMSQITMGNTWVKLLWVIHAIHVTIGNTYDSNYYG